MRQIINPQEFWSNILILEDDDCWEWINTQGRNRYGQYLIGGKPVTAHRIAWEITHGAIPQGLCVRHDCDNRSCANPKHLKLGTHADNMRDMAERKRSHWGNQTHCVHGHSLEDAYVYAGRRNCRQCCSIRAKAWETKPGIREQRNAQLRERRRKLRPLQPEQLHQQ